MPMPKLPNPGHYVVAVGTWWNPGRNRRSVVIGTGGTPLRRLHRDPHSEAGDDLDGKAEHCHHRISNEGLADFGGSIPGGLVEKPERLFAGFRRLLACKDVPALWRDDRIEGRGS